MEEQILSIMRRVFRTPELVASCSQSNCKAWDSMNHLNLIVELEMELGISFEPEEIARMVSYQDVLQIVSAKSNE